MDEHTELLSKFYGLCDDRNRDRDRIAKLESDLKALQGRFNSLSDAYDAHRALREHGPAKLAPQPMARGFHVCRPNALSVHYSPGHVFYTDSDESLFVYHGATHVATYARGDWFGVSPA